MTEWQWNDPNEVWMKESGAVSYKRQHLILSFLGHSWVIQTSFHGPSRAKFVFEFLNDDGMTEWWGNDRHLRIHFFSPSPKTPPFHLIPSFHIIYIIFEWRRIKITMGRYHSTVILVISTSFQSFWNDRMRSNEGGFLNKGKTLNSEISRIRLHSVIPSEYSLLHRIIPFIWGSFRHSNLIPVPNQ